MPRCEEDFFGLVQARRTDATVHAFFALFPGAENSRSGQKQESPGTHFLRAKRSEME